MGLFSRFRFKEFFAKLGPSPSKQRFSFGFLNAAQFFGAVNDNVFKLLLIFLLIDLQGPAEAPTILAIAGAIYVIPFLLFSSSAGILADRFSKQKMLIGMKIAEMTIMALAILAFSFKAARWGYPLLFLLSTHSAIFGPSKYGIIPELVKKEAISKANGFITAFTYLAIIIGTFLGSFLTDITNHNFVLATGVCFLIAVAGFVCTLRIKQTPPQGSTKKFSPLFITEIVQTLKYSRDIKHLFTVICSDAFFLFLGAFTQLNIIPFAIQSLNLSEVAGGYLFLSTAMGIALGAYIAGKASRKRIEIGFSCLAALVMAVSFFVLSTISTNLTLVIICLVILGIAGGIFVVPLESFIQVFSPNEKRGQVIAATNFLSFTGVLLASFALYLFSNILKLSSASGFAIVGAITLGVALILMLRLSDIVIPFFVQKLIKPFYAVQTIHSELLTNSSSTTLILLNPSRLNTLLLMSVTPPLYLLIPKDKKPGFFQRWVYSYRFIAKEDDIEKSIQVAKAATGKNEITCLPLSQGAANYRRRLGDLWKFSEAQVIFATVDRKLFNTTITFSKTPNF